VCVRLNVDGAMSLECLSWPPKAGDVETVGYASFCVYLICGGFRYRVWAVILCESVLHAVTLRRKYPPDSREIWCNTVRILCVVLRHL
jgi:hypothetical protein